MQPLLNPVYRTMLNLGLSAVAALLRSKIGNQSTLELVLAFLDIPSSVVEILSDEVMDDKAQLKALANKLVTDSLLQRILMARADQLAEQVDHPILTPLIKFSTDTLQRVTAALTDADPNNKEQLLALAQEGVLSPDLIDVIAAALRGLLPEDQSRPLIMLLLTNIIVLFDGPNGIKEQVPGTLARAKELRAGIDALNDPIVNSRVMNEDLGVIGLPARPWEINTGLRLGESNPIPGGPVSSADFILGNSKGTP